MHVEVELVDSPVGAARELPAGLAGHGGARVDFQGIVRSEEHGNIIAALEYEAYRPMAERVIRDIIRDLALEYPCLFMRVVHRIGVIPVGEIAILVTVLARHRDAAFAMVSRFMDRLKQDVPIWKTKVLPASTPASTPTA